MRQRTVRTIQVVEERGAYGKCTCGGEVLFYSDFGVRCKACGKLYGTWFHRKRAAIRHSQETLFKVEGDDTKEQEEIEVHDDVDPYL
ncbi:MAG: hypothetical protein ACUVWK_06410 [Nitrososphaerales archaeon]